MLRNTVRQPAVAGRFYPSDKNELLNTINKIYKKEEPNIAYELAEKNIIGAVVPHAGYMYSAYQAIHFFGLLKLNEQKVDTFVIINPNHTGYGEEISLDDNKYWDTPLGNIEQDEELIKHLELPFSNLAHQNEHSGEVMLPLLQRFIKDNFKVVIITMLHQNKQNAEMLAKKLNMASNKTNRRIMLIASSDFTHFMDVESGYRLDDMVLKQIDEQSTENVEKVVRKHNISVCGFGPIMCLMEYAALQGEYESKIMARGHSGMVSYSEKVVNYINILFYHK